jgi:hypothetical protein
MAYSKKFLTMPIAFLVTLIRKEVIACRILYQFSQTWRCYLDLIAYLFYEALLGEIVHGDTTRLSVNLAIDSDIQKLTRFYARNSKVKWFASTYKVHMIDLGYEEDELKLVENLCKYLEDWNDAKESSFFGTKVSQDTLEKIVNRSGTSGTIINRTIEIVSSQGIFQVLYMTRITFSSTSLN